MALDPEDNSSVLPDHGPSRVGMFHDFKRSVARERFICTYFDQLNVEYQTLCPDDYRERTLAIAQQLRVQHAAQPSWALNHRFEHL